MGPLSMNEAKIVSHKNKMLSIANQLRYGLVAIVVSSVLIAGSALTYLSFREQAKQTRLLQQERAQGAANKISGYLDNLQRQLNYLSELRGLTDFNSETQRRILDGLANSNSAYEIVGILNERGQVVQAMSPYAPISFSSSLLLQISGNSPMFLEIFRMGQNYISPVEIDSEINLPVATLALPIRNSQNKIAGILFAKINLNFLTQIVDRTQVGKTGYAYILDNRSVLIARKDSNPSRFNLQNLKDRPFVRELFKLSLSPEIQPAIVYQGLNGEEVVGTATIVRRVQWMVAVELPISEAYAPVRSMVLVMGGATLISALAAVALGIIFSRSITIPLKYLAAAASRISGGEFGSRVNIATSNEFGELAQSFNRMAEELQRYFKKLQDSEQRLAQFLEAMPVGVFIVNEQGQPYYVNSHAEQLLAKGLVADATTDQLREIYQMYLTESKEIYPKEYDPIRCALQGKSVNIDNMEIHQPDKIIPIEVWGTPIYDEQGNIAYALAAFTDITQRKQAEKLLAEYNRNLEIEVQERTQELSQAIEHLKAAQQELIISEKMAALGQLIAGVAHEVNTPLAAIRSSVENIIDFFASDFSELPEFFQQLSPERYSDFFTLLENSTHQQMTLSSKEKRQLKKALILELEAHTIEKADTIADTLIDIGVYNNVKPFLPCIQDQSNATILQRAYQISSIQKSAATIKIATDRAAKIVFALKSYARYDHSGKKVVANIVEGIETVLTLYHNQFKQGVEVIRNYEPNLPSVLCYPDELNQVWTNLIHNALQAMDYKGTLTIEVKQQNRSILVKIIDSGKGISPEIIPRIFEPFFTTKLPGEGSGLGLDIARKIIERHTGKIEVNSLPGKTIFTVSFPITF